MDQAYEGLKIVKKFPGTALEFSRYTAKYFDEDRTLNQLLARFNSSLAGCRLMSATEIQKDIEANWAKISTHIDLPFPTAHIWPSGGATRMTIEPEVAEFGNRTMWLNPYAMPKTLSPREPLQVAIEKYHLGVFVHELRHLQQFVRKDFIAKDGDKGYYWKGQWHDLNDEDAGKIETYLNFPHEIDANTTSMAICQTLS